VANLRTLKPFQKGHKKLGGRKKGVPNKNSLLLDKVVIAAATQVGSDGKGKDGVVGYLASIFRTSPKLAVKFLVRILAHETKHPPKDLARRELIRILQSLNLTQQQRAVLTEIGIKISRIPE
jgi:hypothetical protein